MRTRTKSLILLCLLCSSVQAANDFSSEPNLVAWYEFEPGVDFFSDSTANGNDLSMAANYAPAQYSTDKQEGSYSAQFTSVENDTMSRLDSKLSSDFPGKSGTTIAPFTVTCWYKPTAVNGYYTIVSKFDYSTACSWTVSLRANNKIYFYWGYNSGNSSYLTNFYINHAVTLNKWFFVKVVFNSPGLSISGMLYDTADDTTTTMSNSPGNAMSADTAPFRIGSINNADFCTGLVDDVAIFSREVSDSDANDIRGGTFNWGAEPNLISHYTFEADGFGKDSAGTNNILNLPVQNTSDVVVGSGCESFSVVETHSSFMQRADADLSSAFPLKNGDANKKISVCYWVKYASLPSGPSWYVHWFKGSISARSFAVGAGNAQFGVAIGNNGGATWQLYYHGTALQTGRWYHVGMTYDDADKSYKMRIWDATAGSLLGGDEVTGTAGSNIYVGSGGMTVGSSSYYPGSGQEWNDGLIDDMQVFNRILSSSEIDQIRAGTYGAPPAGGGSQVIIINMD
jgi:Concanavalin A-like lectin/glucanases superfamily